jgi:HD-GYP domain-containing protein (c-di-GMP phosphodiesterase class II)
VALSLATDLGTGQPMEHGLRTCWLSLAAAEQLGLGAAARSSVYYVALLRFLGCTSYAAETAVVAGGDDVGFNAAMAPVLMAQPSEAMRYFIGHLAEELPLRRRIGRVVRAVSDPGMTRRSLAQHCEVGARLAARVGLGESVCHALAHAYERWDGKGHPAGLSGEDVPVAVRIVSVARDAELWARQAGWPTAVEVLAHRRGHGYDPAVVDVVVDGGERWLAESADDPCAMVLDAEPEPVVRIDDGGLDAALAAVADFTDIKSPWLRGHSSGVAELVVAAARAAGWSEVDGALLGRAALVHDVGRVGVPNGIWDRRGPLSAGQWERVRLHPYLTDRVLRRCALLVPFAGVAAAHHERVDGSGYHRGATGEQLDAGARLLAAADTFHAMAEDRPHRSALSRTEAEAQLLGEVDAGRFGRAEVDAVLHAAGHTSSPARVTYPAGLTEREIQVLCLIARGEANKQVATALGISPKTVGRHIEHIYAKAGVSTRPERRCSRWSTACWRTDPPGTWGEHPIASPRRAAQTGSQTLSKPPHHLDFAAVCGDDVEDSHRVRPRGMLATSYNRLSEVRASRFDVDSTDGTSLAVWVEGAGPGLVLVHGSIADHTTFDPFVAVLHDDLTTFSMDRRGFGASGDTPDYSIEQDFADVAAVVDTVAARTGGPVALWGIPTAPTARWAAPP